MPKAVLCAPAHLMLEYLAKLRQHIRGPTMITIDDFRKLDLRVAQIKEIKEHPNADKLYLIQVDVGGELKQIVAGIRNAYTKEELLGKKVIIVNNLEPATIRGETSNGMLLAASDSQGMAVLTVEKEIVLGSVVK